MQPELFLAAEELDKPHLEGQLSDYFDRLKRRTWSKLEARVLEEGIGKISRTCVRKEDTNSEWVEEFFQTKTSPLDAVIAAETALEPEADRSNTVSTFPGG